VEGDFLRSGLVAPRELGCIDTTARGPSGKGWLTGMRRIGDELYAVGMARQVYVRGRGRKWRRIDEDLLAKPSEAAGLHDVDGFSSKEVYAGGLGGEIWRFDGIRWHRLESPTSGHLRGVRCCGDWIYMVGEDGSVLRGRQDRFEVIASEPGGAALLGVESFRDCVYVASAGGVFRLDGRTLREVSFGLEGEVTAGKLASGDGVLWSVGKSHLLTTEDGHTWSQMFV